MMRRIGIVALVLLGLLGISQLVIPPIIESRISDRLTAAGGSAHVSVSALPAIRLLFGEGSRIEVTGSGLNLTSQSESGTVFSNLDGYDNVNVNLDHFHAGPFQMGSFELTRSGPEAEYHLVAQGRTTPTDLASYGTSQLGLPGGPLLSYLGGKVLGQDFIPINLDMNVQSDGGRVMVTSGGGTIAGLPTGPLAELITSVVVVKL
jgi:hypothetical protein